MFLRMIQFAYKHKHANIRAGGKARCERECVNVVLENEPEWVFRWQNKCEIVYESEREYEFEWDYELEYDSMRECKYECDQERVYQFDWESEWMLLWVRVQV